MKIGYTTDELLDTEKHQEGFIFFDDLLDSNQKAIDPFFTRRQHIDLDVCYSSQGCFDLPKKNNLK